MILLVVKINCIQVFDNNSENVTITEPLIKDSKVESTTTLPEGLISEEPKTVENESEKPEYRITTSPPTTTSTHKIPTTLLNMKFEKNNENTEKPEKSLKDYV